ncbi:hypothetical protein BANRA_01746 [Escherichia coli]|nr:hypothetical protein BANRA_01746 [Escherichia coli]
MTLCLSTLLLLKGRFQSLIQHIFKYTLTVHYYTSKTSQNITSHTIGEQNNFLK